MAGSHEVRGSIPLCSTKCITVTHSGGRFLFLNSIYIRNTRSMRTSLTSVPKQEACNKILLFHGARP